jgi:hypothetical protein
MIHISLGNGTYVEKAGLPFSVLESRNEMSDIDGNFTQANGSTCHSPVKGDGNVSKKTALRSGSKFQIRRLALRRKASGLTP